MKIPKKAKYAIAITLYLAVLIGSYLHFRHILYWDIHRAIQTGNTTRVRVLIALKPHLVHKVDFNGNTPLHKTVIYSGQPDSPESLYAHLLEKGADIEAKDNSGRTPLRVAVDRQQIRVVEFLIEKGAEVQTKDNNHSTPLHAAGAGGVTPIVRLLIKNGASVNAKDNSKFTPLANAALNQGNQTIMKMLIDAGANVNEKVVFGGNILHNLAQYHREDPDVYRFLIDNGADINAKDKYGKTPLDHARQRNMSKVVDFLVSRGAVESTQ